jgi:hypothetical protein
MESINPILGLSWQSTQDMVDEYGETAMDGFVDKDFYFLAGTIETPGFKSDDWLYA